MVTPVGGIAISNTGPFNDQTFNNTFILPSTGVYRISWHITVVEAVSTFTISYFPPGALVNSSFVTNITGNSEIVGDVLFTNFTAGTTIQIQNRSGHTITVVTTANQAPVLIIQQLS